MLGAVAFALLAPSATVYNENCNNGCATCSVAQQWEDGKCYPVGNAPPYHSSQKATISNATVLLTSYKGDNCTGDATQKDPHALDKCVYFTGNIWSLFTTHKKDEQQALSLPAVATDASACEIKYTNNADVTVTACLRHNGDAPGSVWQKELAPNTSTTVGCRSTAGANSWQTYTTRPGGKCEWNNCTTNTGTCNYPWVIGQGVSADNGNWYGSIGANWDGAGFGFQGEYAKVGYGVSLTCTAYKTQHINDVCTVNNGEPTCNGTNAKPNYGRASSGVELCDPGQTLLINLNKA